MHSKGIILSIILLALLFAAACSKVEDDVIYYPEDPNTTYYPMNIGNYWVYEEYTYDSLGEKPTGEMDSTFIDSDTTINGNKYFVYRTSSSPFWSMIMRDSSGYLVDNFGVVYFHSKSYGDTLYKKVNYNLSGDTLSAQFRVMYKLDLKIKVPAGLFKAEDARYFQIFPLATISPKRRISFNYYSANVGLVYRDYDYLGTRYILKLVRYHIEE